MIACNLACSNIKKVFLLVVAFCVGALQSEAAFSQVSASVISDIVMIPESCAIKPDLITINDLQNLGSHNSYKLFLPSPEFNLLEQHSKSQSLAIDYNHIALSKQLDLGLRQLELDIFYDPEGGLFTDPLLPKLTQDLKDSHRFESQNLAQPGFKVLHTKDVDVHSNCKTWVQCLTEVSEWSFLNPEHLPILIMFNAKEGGSSFPGASEALRFTEDAFLELEKETLSVLDISQIITPDDVRGGLDSLRQAVLERGWPPLNSSRGKFMFAVDEGPEKVLTYARNKNSLEGLLFFVNSISENHDHAAYFTRNDPINDQSEIARLVELGFLVRTRADASTREARNNDIRRRDAALKSGAQFVSTDYYLPRLDLSDYSVTLPKGNPSRLNPIRFKEKCNLGY